MDSKQNVREFELDFSQCASVHELYSVIQETLELPEWFGKNINALWDALTGIMVVPAVIKVSRTVKNQELLQKVEQIIQVMKRAEAVYHEITVIEA